MILIEEVDNKEYLTELFKAIYDDLPTPKRKITNIRKHLKYYGIIHIMR